VSGSNRSWSTTICEYLADPEPARLRKAIAAAPEEPELRDLLAAVARADGDTFDALARSVGERFEAEGRSREAAAVALLVADSRATLLLADAGWRRLPPERQRPLAQIILSWCRRAERLARSLDTAPCMARYRWLAGRAHMVLDDPDAAISDFRASLGQHDSQASAQGAKHNEAALVVHSDLAVALAQRHEWAEAEAQSFTALELSRQLPRRTPGQRLRFAGLLNNHGNVLLTMQQLSKAERALARAVRVVEPLAQEGNPAALHTLFQTWVNRSLVTREQALAVPPARRRTLLQIALARLARAEEVWFRLPPDEQARHELDRAHFENNMGATLAAAERWNDAARHLDSALGVYRRYAAPNHSRFDIEVGRTANTLCYVLRHLASEDADAGHAALTLGTEALALAEQSPIQASLCHANLGFLKETLGNVHGAYQHFEQSIELFEVGASSLSDWQHRHLFKGDLETVVLRLAARYARGVREGDDTLERLVGLLEALRQSEALPGFRKSDSQDWTAFGADALGWRSPLRSLLGTDGQLHTQFRERRAGLMYLHALRDQVLFVMLTPQDVRVELLPAALWRKFLALQHRVARQLANTPRSVGQFLAWNPRSASELRSAMQTVREELTPGVRSFLAVCETLFVSPCRTTVNLPLELLPVQDPEGNQVPFCLNGILARVFGLGQLFRVLEREPRGSRALIVKDPGASGEQELKHGRRLADDLFETLTTHGLLVEQLGGTAKGLDPEALVATLDTLDLGLWSFIGHGRTHRAGDDAGEELVLGRGRHLRPYALRSVHWQGTLVDLAACLVGAVRGGRGGSFTGFPAASLERGASCVLSSPFLLLDNFAARQGECFYRYLLDPETPREVGEALRLARAALAAQTENPLCWATLSLWGNPWVKLRASEKI